MTVGIASRSLGRSAGRSLLLLSRRRQQPWVSRAAAPSAPLAAAAPFPAGRGLRGGPGPAMAAIRALSTTATVAAPPRPKPPPHAMLSLDRKVLAPPLVVIEGEEMTHYATQLFVKEWFEPYFDLRQWERFDLSCAHRDATDDQVLRDAVAAGKRVGAIFKEPTITPSALQREQMGLKNALGSPNGAMRRGWNGITIS